MADLLERYPLADLRTRTSVKWRYHPPDVLPLWVAEMDVPLAPAIVQAVSDAVARGDLGYASGVGDVAGTAFVETFAGFASTRWGWSVPTDRTALVPDVMRGAIEVLRLVTPPGSRVIINPPVYPPFYAHLQHDDREVVEVPLTADGRLDLTALEAAMAEGAAGYLLCSPHNPTGTVHRTDELAAVATLARRHGVRVVSDEIHAPLVLPGATFVPYLTVPGAEDAVAVVSASKGWNVPGVKAALAIAGEAAGDDLARLSEVVTHGASHLAVVAQTAALRDGVDWLDELLSALSRRRDHLARLLDEHLPAVRWRPGAATYLAWLDCRDLDLPGRPATHFLDEGRVALLPGEDFGAGGAGHVRCNFATSTAILDEAVQRMAASLDRHHR
jgi:cystathionine beta-lyase